MSYIIELTMGFHFVTVGVSLLSYSRDVIAGKSTLSFDCISIGEFLGQKNAMSSADIVILECLSTSWMPFLNTENNSGPRMLPCGTRMVILAEGDCIITDCS